MATKTTIEVPVEEQITTTDFVEETSNQASEVEATGEIARLSKEEVLTLLAEKVASEPSASLRNEVEALKVAFYKLHRADMEARRKAFFAENGDNAEYTPQTDEAEVRFKELYNIYRTILGVAVQNCGEDADKIRERFMKQLELRERGDDEAEMLDEDFLTVLWIDTQ